MSELAFDFEEGTSQSRQASRLVLEKLIQKLIDKKSSSRGHDDDDEEDDLIIKQDSDDNDDHNDGIESQVIDLLAELIPKINETLMLESKSTIVSVFD